MSDKRPGIRRERVGQEFVYVRPDGTRVTDELELQRIRKLAIPPAWGDVWICPVPNGHLQACGRDAKGRKQYRYHPRWREVRDEGKYSRMIAFAEALPAIRQRVEDDLSQRGLPRNKVVATVVRLLETTCIRVGNEEYARANGSFGLTTMRDRHVAVRGATVEFTFKGKAGKTHRIDVSDRRLATIVKRCRDLPGYELFQYVDEEGRPEAVDSADVNDYLREVSGQEFTAKDFRTWAGTVLTALALDECESAGSPSQCKKNIVAAIERVARRLGNTPAICRKSYVHPAVLNAYADGLTLRAVREVGADVPTGKSAPPSRASDAGLRPEEAAVLALLRVRLDREARAA